MSQGDIVRYFPGPIPPVGHNFTLNETTPLTKCVTSFDMQIRVLIGRTTGMVHSVQYVIGFAHFMQAVTG